MLQLNVHAVEILKLFRNFTNMPVAKLLHAAMWAAQQVLVEIEHLHLHAVLKLLLQGPGIARYSAKLVVGADDRDARALRHAVTRFAGFCSYMHSREVPVCICLATSGRDLQRDAAPMQRR
ncbi:hypothetical protein ACLF3G_00625 [Falsiroseomonas sp. HC035]|uniref:hypothetical protein n=1 Tax=Falsiroseomonas sp. HC035 TaxID=3390999 RepID=UPI003D323978